jgi:ubiquinone/menaquinone biosynthesis C-methylase UbiE
MSSCLPRAESAPYVSESRFGIWFLGTKIWEEHVLAKAIDDLARLIDNRKPAYPVVVDIGCGWGRSFKMLKDRFKAERLIGVDIDPQMIKAAGAEAVRQGLSVELYQAAITQLPLRDASADLVFCHQTFHHLVDQHRAIRECRRVLKPGGVLLFAESTRAYIHSWIIRMLFRHPMQVQRTAPEYLAMLGNAGFLIDAKSVSYPYSWWSRPDLGITERWFGVPPPAGREETLVNLVAVRP